MKVKHFPEDFVVEEIPAVALRKKGPYAICALTKVNTNLTTARGLVIKRLNVYYKHFSWAGIKDKRAKTTQWVSIKMRRGAKLNFTTPEVSLQHLGFSSRPLQSGDLKGNKFTITLRDLTEEETKKIEKNMALIRVYGVPNYFDDQRFGEDLSKSGFIAKRLIKGDYETAVKLYLTSSNHASHERNMAHNAIQKSWGKWAKCYEAVRGRETLRTERRMLFHLQNNQKDMVAAFRMIPSHTKEMLIAAYQSYLWNKCLAQVLKGKVNHLKEKKYKAGVLKMYTGLTAAEFNDINSREIPMLSPATQCKDPYIKEVVERVLKKEGIEQKDLRVRKIRNLFFKTRTRTSLMIPQGMRVLSQGPDEAHEGKEKMTITFSCEKGAYATIVLKCLEG